MIVLVKRKNAVLILLILFLSVAIFSIDGRTSPIAETIKENTGAAIVIDAGHGGEDPGKVSNYSSLAEKDLNLRIAQLLKDLLEQDGYTVYMTRTEDKLNYSAGTKEIYQKRKQDLTARKKFIDESGADAVVSIHMNSFSETKYYGAQTFYPPSSIDSERLAKNIQNALIDVCDKTNKRTALLKKERIILFRDLKVPTALVECGFLSNPEEEAKLKTLEYQELLAKGIKKGIDSFFGKE
ncbi:MAG: cell wall hydrolase [Clostridiaceae bacterium]|jgi:N-acetylmuramoyl-L-alanine amidase|nr:cell wall hydrolase [Clostridiaceae bacterium]